MGCVRVLFFASAREAAGCESADLSWDGGNGLSLPDFWAKLTELFPGMAPFRANVRVARNLEYLMEGQLIASGDEVALIPPVSGG